uniref:YTH domain-containing family protein n=1 Tax=Gossypium raimondii TaxID=29730 RepID=A0A0D2SSS9_GOSRA|nr:hypothetical protein B456_007G288900 [Gossypium raimondii]
MATSDQVADSLENLSLDSQSKTTKAPEPVKKDFYSDNGSYMYPQTYGYMSYAPYSIPSPPLPAMGHDGQLHALQEYYYPSPYYQQPLQTSQANASQVDVSSFGATDQSSLSVDTNKGNSNGITSGGSGSLKPTLKSSSLNPNAFYKGGGLPTGNLSQGYQDPRFSYDGIQSPIPWLDMSMSPNGQSEQTANGGFSSYTNNLSSGRNQNLHPFPHVMNMHNARPSSGVGQAYGYMNHMYPNNITYGHYGNTIRGGSGFGSYGYDARKKGLGWYNVGNNKSRFRGYGKENIDGFNELNKGPRVKGYKNKDGSGNATLAVKDQNLPLTKSNNEDIVSLVPDTEQYNREDFPDSYSDAMFFVIKSYSEDDVHKSIKYNVWASTSNGNKKLDAAFREAKEKPDGCPVFLLFSVSMITSQSSVLICRVYDLLDSY